MESETNSVVANTRDINEDATALEVGEPASLSNLNKETDAKEGEQDAAKEVPSTSMSLDQVNKSGNNSVSDNNVNNGSAINKEAEGGKPSTAASNLAKEIVARQPVPARINLLPTTLIVLNKNKMKEVLRANNASAKEDNSDETKTDDGTFEQKDGCEGRQKARKRNIGKRRESCAEKRKKPDRRNPQ